MNGSIDTLVRAETPEGIAIAIRPAGLAVRALAFFIDVVIRYCVLSLAIGILSISGRFSTGPIFIAIFVIGWLYPIVFELLPGAATPGKRSMGLQVVMANGLPITPAGSLIRNLMRTVDLLPLGYLVGAVSILLRTDARRLGDLAGGTMVAYRSEAVRSRKIQDVAPFAPRRSLSARQRAAITAFAWRADNLTAERAEEIAGLAARVMSVGPDERMSTRLIGVARWLHGERREPVKQP